MIHLTNAFDPLLIAAPLASGVVTFAGLVAYGVVNPRTRIMGPLVYRGPAGAAGAALTFDDGPTPGGTDHVLDALRDAGAVATFFVVGRNVERHPDLLRRIDAEGHAVGNHTFEHSHTALWRRWPVWREEIRRADDAIERVIGRRPAIFRPPMGMKTWHVIKSARHHGQTVVTWNRRACDAVQTDAAAILRRLAGRVAARDIVVLHDGIEPHARPRDPAPTAEAIGPLIADMRRRGVEPARLDALLGIDAYRAG